MKKNRNDLKFLLMQIREDQETCLEEYYEFVDFAKISEQQLETFNVFQTPEFGIDILTGFDALFVGGSSDATVLDPKRFTFVPSCNTVLSHCHATNFPVFASCFGFQVVVNGLGGKIILDKENMEMGTYKIHLTHEAKLDPLTHDCPDSFIAVSGHQERASHIPEDAVLLAYSEICPFHLIRFKDKPFYASQFHPEVSTKDLKARITRYQDRYLDDAESLQQIIDSAIDDTDIANDLIAKFVDRIVCGEE